MISGLADELRAHGVEEIVIATWRQDDDWRMVGGQVSKELIPQGDPAARLPFIQRLKMAAALYVIGADVIDGAYGAGHSLAMLDAAQLGVQCGLRTTIVGSSFCERPHPRVVKQLRRLDPRVTMLARDSHSQKRIEQAMERSVPLVADIAFLSQAVAGVACGGKDCGMDSPAAADHGRSGDRLQSQSTTLDQRGM